MFNVDFYKNKRILLTGHTGFKGTWMSLILEYLGSELYGFSLPESDKTPFYYAVQPNFKKTYYGYIQDKKKVEQTVAEIEPEIIIHFASHSTLNRSAEITDYIFESNINGVINLLESVRKIKSVKSILIVTSDKCYKNIECDNGYREDAVLGAQDPYSTSKACQELITECYRKSFFSNDKLNIPIATARASNVIGGGDFNLTRLFPYLLNCFSNGKTAEIRSPLAIRPWQNVLDVLGGYLTLTELLYESDDASSIYSSAFNFGPDEDGFVTVKEAVEILAENFSESNYAISGSLENVIETKILKLDSSKSREILNWYPLYSFKDTIKMAADFEIKSHSETLRDISLAMIKEYLRGISNDR